MDGWTLIVPQAWLDTASLRWHYIYRRIDATSTIYWWSKRVEEEKGPQTLVA